VPLRPRTTLLLVALSVLGAAAFTWPLLLRHNDSTAYGHEADAPFLVAALLALLLGAVLAEVADGGLDAKALAMLGVLAALVSVLRLIDAGTALGEGLVWFLMVPAGRVLGRGFGFLLGALALFASALLTVGVGPWLPFQMCAAGWFALGAGCLPRRLSGRTELVVLAGYGLVGGELYGLLMDLSFWPFRVGSTGSLAFVAGAPLATNVHHFLAFHAITGLGYDLLRGVGTAVLVLLTGRPLLAALRRAARRSAFDAPAVFTAPASGGEPRAEPVAA